MPLISKRRLWLPLLLSLVALLALAACSKGKGGPTSSSPTKPPSTTAAGGAPPIRDLPPPSFGAVTRTAEAKASATSAATVSLPSGPTLTVPAGAVDTSVTLKVMQAAVPAALTSVRPVTDLFYISSDTRPIAKGSHVLDIPFDPAKLPVGVTASTLAAYALHEGSIPQRIP
jgi:hypothetical protein